MAATVANVFFQVINGAMVHARAAWGGGPTDLNLETLSATGFLK
jgi:hypothetical protein